jgi:putative transposase
VFSASRREILDLNELIREGKVKRYFRATRKLDVPGLVSHITQRAAGKEPLFVEEADYLEMIRLLNETARRHALMLYAFCLMPNHLHLLLSLREGSLYDVMRNLFAQYAARFNRKYERKGHLFGGPYRQSACLEDAYLLGASLYIHLNPVRAGLVHDPGKYRWSSSRLYARTYDSKILVHPELVLGLLGEAEPEARRRYRDLLQQGATLTIKPVSEEKKAVEVFLTGLAQRIPRLWAWLGERPRRVGRRAPALQPSDLWEERIAELRCDGFGRKPESRAAVRHLIEQLISRGYKREEIARRLGVSRKTVYNLLRSLPILALSMFG